MKRIIVPTDFSITAEKAFRLAVDIARKSGGTVLLFHSYIPVESELIETRTKRSAYNLRMEEDIMKKLLRLRKKVAGDSGDVPVSMVVGRSPVIRSILRFAKDNYADLIVMGTQGASGLKKTVIGSVAARIVEKSTVPVLLVPEKFETIALKKMVFATNYQAADRDALSMTLQLAGYFGAGMTVVHLFDVLSADEDKEAVGFENYADSIRKAFRRNRIDFQLCKTASVSHTMESLDQEIPYDLLAMVRRKKNITEKLFLKSFTRDMAYVTKKPLLVIPANPVPKNLTA